MNTNIKALVQRAIDSQPTECSYTKEQWLEAFALDVVNQCIEQFKPTQYHEAYAPSFMGGVDGLDLLYGKVAIVKLHFGVE